MRTAAASLKPSPSPDTPVASGASPAGTSMPRAAVATAARSPRPTHPDQLEFDFPAAPPPTPPARRFRSYELPILLFVARHGAALAQQVIRRFATLDGKWPRPIVRTVRDMVSDGVLESRPLNPAAGRSSRQVLTLTPDGWSAVGQPSATDPLTEPVELIAQRLQLVELHIAMEVRAWRLLTDPLAKWAAIRTWGVRHFSRPGRSDLDKAHLLRISKMAPQAVPLQVWHHAPSRHVLFAVPSYRGHNLGRLLATMPNLTLFPPLAIYVVGAFPSRVAADCEVLTRWATRTRHLVDVRTIESFADRPNPLRAGRPRPSQYRRYGAPSPRNSRAFDA